MSRHGLNQFLNSIGVCLVMLTGLGVGVWFAQQNQPTQRRVAQHPAEYEYDAEFETDEEWEAPLRHQASRRVATKPSTARRPAIQQRTSTRSGIRQAAFQEEEDEMLVPEPLEAEEAEVPDEEMEAETDPEAVPARVAVLPPGTVPLVGAALGQATGLQSGVTGISLQFNSMAIPSNTLGVAKREQLTLTANVSLANPPPNRSHKLRVRWTLQRPSPVGFSSLETIDQQFALVTPINPMNGSVSFNIPLNSTGVYQFTAELLDQADAAIAATTAVTNLTIVDQTPSITNGISQVEIKMPGATPETLIIPASTSKIPIRDHEFSVTLNQAAPPEARYLLVAQAQGNSFVVGSLPPRPTTVSPQTAPSRTSIPVNKVDFQKVPAGEYKLWLVDDWSGALFPATGSIRLPKETAPRIAQLKITQFSSSPYLHPESKSGVPRFYPDYLKITGTGWDNSVHGARFYLFVPGNPNTWLLNSEISASATALGMGNWQAELKIPAQKTSQLRMVAVSENNEDINFSDVQSIDQQPSAISSIKPAISAIKKSDNSAITTNTQGVYTSREREISVSVTGTNTPTDAAMLIRDNKTKEILGQGKVADAGTTSVAVTLPGFGEFELVAVLSQGPATNLSQVSAPVKVLVVNQGPTVADVIPKNFGSEAIGKEIRVTFNTPVGINEAALASQFELKRRYGRNDSRLEADFTIANATLSTDKKTVVLTTKDEPVVDSYRLIIKKSLEDTLGNKLRGDGLNTGTEFSIVLSPGVALAGGFEPEVPARTAVKHVEYGEYTETRKNPDTFLPSDHVETRVARLYYYRDAHRVAQIINREVQSLNRAAAAQKRQLADKARREAEQGTKERRTYEMRASQLAQKARLAEEELARDEQDRAAALQQIETVTQQIEADEVRLSEWRADLNTLTSTTTPPLPTQQQLLQLKEQIQETERNVANARNRLTAVKADLQATTARISRGVSAVQAARDSEIKANNDAVAAEQTEALLSADRFRREVAAAHEDPDTYAAGKPESKDPVAQVTISVIGEGVIQLRGPLSGVNKIRTMINEIDQPVGQVRISIHTAQVNGEHGDRMEKVVNRIEDHIEHAKFLTTRTTEMLRQSIVEVAAEKATQAAEECEGEDQFARDEKYLYAFFGKDFVDELRDMDSEFLKTGNKLLSIHSMDTTSLASSLFVLALAKNETRQEILALFNCRLIEELPPDEKKYYMAGYRPHFWGDGKNKTRKLAEFGKGEDKRLMALNAKFANFSGYFNNHLSGTDTLNPAQREFIKLAQIFKSRLITEVELRQRVVERGLIEQNDPDRVKNEQALRQKARDAQTAQENALRKRLETQSKVITELTKATGIVQSAFPNEEDQLGIDLLSMISTLFANNNPPPPTGGGAIKPVAHQDREQPIEVPQTETDNSVTNNLKTIEARLQRLQYPRSKAWVDHKSATVYLTIRLNTVNSSRVLASTSPDQSPREFSIASEVREYPVKVKVRQLLNDSILEYDSSRSEDYGVSETDFLNSWKAMYLQVLKNVHKRMTYLNQFRWDAAERSILETERSYHTRLNDRLIQAAKASEDDNDKPLYRQIGNIKTVNYIFILTIPLVEIRTTVRLQWTDLVDQIVKNLAEPTPKYNQIETERLWRTLKARLAEDLTPEVKNKIKFNELEVVLDKAFMDLAESVREEKLADHLAKIFTNPLDHRRFLDFLIAETEDKYIELLEGTRSHTANIDNYIKRLITALDDDFNTQFYKPAFQGVRQASRLWDVNLSQIETTSILTNNRQFGKVSPQATMEFDLPKRDILIQEAFKGAKASFDEYGALMNDPTFLAMAKLRSGQPTSSPSQRGAGDSAVRNVLPGLPSTTDEHILGQAGPGNREFDSPLESLIPDPAIYKFETGTGFEVRPVIQPDGQAVVFHFQYLYRANIREPIRADEKHLGRVKEHFIDTDVQLSNFELRKVSDYVVALKTSRTSRGVPLMEDIPGVGMLFRPLPSAESSLQQNVVMAQATIFPTLFDLMGLRWAPAVADVDQIELQNENYTVRGRRKAVSDRVYDFSSEQVDEFLQIEEDQRRKDLYRNQKPIGTRLPFPYPNPDECEAEMDGSSAPAATPGSEDLVPDPLEDDGLNPRGITVPEPAAKRGQPTRQAQRPRGTGVELLPPPPQSGTMRRSAPGSIPPPPPIQQRTQPRGPQFVEPVPLPPESSRTSPNQRRGVEQSAPAPRRQAENTQPRLIDPVNYEVDARSSTKPAATNTDGRASVGRASVGQGPATTNVPPAKAPAGKSLLPWFKKTVK